MKSIHTLFTSHLSQEILGGLLGMLIAMAIYFINANIQLSSMKGLLVDSSLKISTGSGVVSVNAKNANPEMLKRLGARANQVSKQLVLSKPAPAIAAIPVDHTDRTAWIQMRAARRDIAAKFDLAATHAAPVSATIATPPKVIAAAQLSGMSEPVIISDDAPRMRADSHLPNSGPILDVVLLLSFVCACILCRESLIAAFVRAH